MITINTNKDKYAALFKKAWDELYYRNIFSEDELKHYFSQGNTFRTLEDYFTRIKDLVTIQENEKYPTKIKTYTSGGFDEIDNPKANNLVPFHYEFIMLPLEEPQFEINANTREIDIPNNFKKLIGVQGDHVAETLVFSINRFFDFVDLYRPDMKIYVQWVDENGKDIATEIPRSRRCYDPISQKILFGWTITEKVTKEARNIQFAVRFVSMVDDNITFSLNTKVHQITIAPALQPDLSGVEIEQISDYVLNAITNSPSTDSIAATPHFALDLDDTIEYDIDENTQLYTLKVSAAVDGDGVLEYLPWKYTNDSDKNIGSSRGEDTYEAAEYNEAEKNSGVRYYIQGKLGSFIESTNPYADQTEGKQLYKRYYTYTLNGSENNVAGRYITSVQNRAGNALSTEVYSKTAHFPGPGEIKQTDLPDGKIIEDGNSYVNVTAAITKPEKTKLNYKLYYSDNNIDYNEDTETVLSYADNNLTFSAKNPGWYYTTVEGTRNGASTGELRNNKICKITNIPSIPILKDEFKYEEEKIIQVTTPSPTVSGILNVELNEDFDTVNPLVSDSIICEWYGSTIEGEAQLIEDTPESRAKYRIVENTPINTLSLQVFGAESALDGRVYYCKVFNILNNRRSADDKAGKSNWSCDFVVV